MEEIVRYLEYAPLFFTMVVLGIVVQFIRSKTSLSFKRVVSEVFSSVWIAILVGAGLENFTDWSLLLISILSSVAGYFNSKIISIIGDDIIINLGKATVSKIKSHINTSYNE